MEQTETTNQLTIQPHPSVQLNISPSKMECFITLIPDEDPLPPKELLAMIKDQEIKYGIDQVALKQAYLTYRDQKMVEHQLIAEGTEDTITAEDDMINKMASNYDDVAGGDILAEIKPAEVVRTNIYGEKKRVLRIAKEEQYAGNVVESKKIEGNVIQLKAGMEGVLTIDGRRWNIYPFEHSQIRFIHKPGEGKVLFTAKGQKDQSEAYTHSMIREYAEVKGIPPDFINWDRVKELIRKANRGEDVPPLEVQTSNSKSPILVEVGTSPDDMFAHLSVRFPPEVNYNVSFEQVKRAIRDAGVSYGFEWDTIKQLVKEVNENLDAEGRHQDLEDHVFAFGQEAQEGMDGEYEIVVDLTDKDIVKNKATMTSTVVKKGALVKKGELLAIQTQGIPGVDGKTVKNKIIRVSSNTVQHIRAATNVKKETEEDNPLQMTFSAQADGMVYFYPETGELNVLPYRDAGCEVVVTNDKMEASLILRSSVGEGTKLDQKMVEGVIENEGIVLTGQAKSTIKNMVNRINRDEATEMEEVIASGAPPKHGKDGKLIYIQKPSEPQFSVNLGDSIDYKTLTGTLEVEKGTTLGYIVPPSNDHRDGYDVYGQVIPAHKGKEVRVNAGSGVKYDTEKGKIYAAEDGRFMLQRDTPFVVKSMEVDQVRQHINFGGMLIIRGDVEMGYKVNANAGIFIVGTVSGSTFQSEGSIVINGGVIGSDVIASEKVHVRSVQGSNIIAYGNVKVREEIIQSTVLSDGLVSLFLGGKGTIYNSVIDALKGIEAMSIGNGKHHNQLTIGRSIRIPELREKLKKAEKELEDSSRSKMPEIQHEIQRFKTEIKQIEAKQEALKPEIKVIEKIMKPTSITIKQKTIELENELAGVIFQLDKAGEKIILEAID